MMNLCLEVLFSHQGLFQLQEHREVPNSIIVTLVTGPWEDICPSPNPLELTAFLSKNPLGLV